MKPRSILPFSLAVTLLVVACGDGGAAPDTDPSSQPSASPEVMVETMRPEGDPELELSLCENLQVVEERLAGLMAVEPRLPNRVALDIELGKLQAAFQEFEQSDLGELEDRLDPQMTRLGYRLTELELAIEDFNTNPRPRRAAPHVQEDAGNLADSLGSFGILARC